MSNKPQAVNFLVCSFLSSTSVDQLVSGVKIQVNAARPADALECVQIKAILKAELESF
jgi:hypothetical protein